MIRINLLPQEERRTRRGAGGFRFDATKAVPLIVLGLVLVASLGTAMVQGTRLSAIERDVAAARADADKYRKTIALIDEMVRKEQELNRRLDLVQQLDRNRYDTVRVLDEVARRVPRYMWLTALKNVSPERYAIDGYAFSNLVVSDLMSTLEKSSVFQDVELSVAQRKVVEGQNTVNFTVTSSIDTAELGDS
jgi:type IV pilus assembly protein PilN